VLCEGEEDVHGKPSCLGTDVWCVWFRAPFASEWQLADWCADCRVKAIDQGYAVIALTRDPDERRYAVETITSVRAMRLEEAGPVVTPDEEAAEGIAADVALHEQLEAAHQAQADGCSTHGGTFTQPLTVENVRRRILELFPGQAVPAFEVRHHRDED
jgi:hypothetical protein